MGGEVLTRSETAKKLLAIAIPITLGSAGLQIINLIDAKIIMGRLLGPAGFIQAEADVLKGIYNFCQTIFNLPCAFIAPLTVSLLPAITAFITKGEEKTAKETAESAARITGLIALPCAVGITVLARPILALLGGYSGQQLEIGAVLLSLQGVMVALYCFNFLSNCVLQSYGKMVMPVVNMILCGILRLPAVYMLVSNPNLGIVGAPLGALIGYVGSAVMNVLVTRKLIASKPRLLGNMLRALLPALIMGVVTWGAYQGMVALVGLDGSRLLLCIAPIAVGVLVYAIGVLLFKAIKKEDCLLLPKGEKIAKLLKLK
jgi:stage V sporulation protein B